MVLWRRPWIAVVAVLLGLLLGAAVGATAGTPEVTRTEVRRIPAPAATPALADTGARRPSRDLLSPEVRARTGDYVADGARTLRVLSVRPARQLPGRNEDAEPLRPRRGERLWVVVIEWRNGGPAPVTAFCSGGAAGLQLVDDEDVFFGAYDSLSEVGGNNDPERGVCEEQNPGAGSRVTVPFFLPAGRRPVGVAVWDSQDAFDREGRSWAFVRTDGAGA